MPVTCSTSRIYFTNRFAASSLFLKKTRISTVLVLIRGFPAARSNSANVNLEIIHILQKDDLIIKKMFCRLCGHVVWCRRCPHEVSGWLPGSSNYNVFFHFSDKDPHCLGLEKYTVGDGLPPLLDYYTIIGLLYTECSNVPNVRLVVVVLLPTNIEDMGVKTLYYVLRYKLYNKNTYNLVCDLKLLN